MVSNFAVVNSDKQDYEACINVVSPVKFQMDYWNLDKTNLTSEHNTPMIPDFRLEINNRLIIAI